MRRPSRTRLLLVAHLGGAERGAAAEEVAGAPAALVTVADLVSVAVVAAPDGRGAPALDVHESARHVNCGGGVRQACEGPCTGCEGLPNLWFRRSELSFVEPEDGDRLIAGF